MKKILFLLPIFLFLFIPKNAFAEDIYSVEPSAFYYYDNTNYTAPVQGTLTTYRSDGTRWYGGYHSVNAIFRSFEYRFFDHGLERYKHYKVQFQFFSYPFYSNFNNPFIFSLDNFNDTFTASCHADTSYDSSYRTHLQTGNNGGPTGWSSVTCDDFYVNNPSTISLKINGILESNNVQRYNWGISKVTFTKITDYETTNAVKDQTEEIKKQTEATNKQTETIKDSDTSDASNSANSFFGDFKSDDYGLSDIVTMPLEFVKGMSSSTCNSLEFPVPFVNQNVKLACMSSIYKKHFSAFLSLYQVITTGLIAYWCCVNMFRLVQNFKNPDNDEVEVLDL